MSSLDWEELNLRYIRIDVLLEKENTKICRVKDTVTNDICVMKIRRGRDLTGIYHQLEGIHHSNLPEIYEVVYDGCNTVIVEEYIPGEGLDQQIRRQVLTEDETMNIALQLCEALTVIHTQEPIIIHRDIKASNVMMRADGVVKLIDFDAARNYHEEQERDTQQMGTLEYASPEHFGYAQTDAKSDIYSVGILMHELLTGETFSQENIHYKGKLRHIICKCTRVKANRRYRTAQQLKRRLNNYRHYKRRRMIVTVLMISVFVLAAGITVRCYRQEKLQQVIEEKKKKPKEQLEKEAFYKRMAAFDKKNGNMANFLRDEYVADEIEKMLGNDTTYFLNNFDEVVGQYNEDEKAYIIYGNRIQSFVSKRNENCSAIVIRENGTIQCVYTYDDGGYYPLICFETNAEEEYHKVPEGVRTWIIEKYKQDYILFVGEEDYQKLWSDIVDVEYDGIINIEGNYVLQSSYGAVGEMNISKEPKKEDSYRIQGTITLGEKKRKINKVVYKRNPYYYHYVDADIEIEIGTFFDSIFLCETNYEDVERDDVPITGQFIKEKEKE